MKAACTNGHPYDEANTYTRPNGVYSCRKCAAARGTAYRHGEYGAGFRSGDRVTTPTGRVAMLTRYREDQRWDAVYLTRGGEDTGEPTILDPRHCTPI